MQVTQYLGYSSLKDFFPSMDIKPNPGCQNQLCGKLQGEHTVRYNSEAAVSARAAAEAAAAEAAAQEVVHEENSWGIAVMPQEATGSTEEPVHRASANGSLVEGIEYSMPVREPITCCSCCCVLNIEHVSCQGDYAAHLLNSPDRPVGCQAMTPIGFSMKPGPSQSAFAQHLHCNASYVR